MRSLTVSVPSLPPEILAEMIPALPDPAQSNNAWETFSPRYLTPLHEALRELPLMYRVSRAQNERAKT